MDEKYLEELLNKMAFNGVIEYNWENPKHEKQYVLPGCRVQSRVAC